jgi:hypothetical protein
VKFYEEAEAVLAQTPRHGVPIVLKPARGKKPAEPYTAPLMWKIVSELRGPRPSIDIHAGRMPARRHDGTGRSRTDRRSGTRCRASQRPMRDMPSGL